MGPVRGEKKRWMERKRHRKEHTETEAVFDWKRYFKSFCPIFLATKEGTEARKVAGFCNPIENKVTAERELDPRLPPALPIRET